MNQLFDLFGIKFFISSNLSIKFPFDGLMQPRKYCDASISNLPSIISNLQTDVSNLSHIVERLYVRSNEVKDQNDLQDALLCAILDKSRADFLICTLSASGVDNLKLTEIADMINKVHTKTGVQEETLLEESMVATELLDDAEF